MSWFIGALVGVAVLVAYRTLRPRRKDLDAGAVSDAWLQQQRGNPKDY